MEPSAEINSSRDMPTPLSVIVSVRLSLSSARVISGVAGFGFWVETVEHKCEGLVSVVSLSDYDEFRLIETDFALVGLRSGKRFRMGDNIRIKVVAANLTKRQLDYEWVITAGFSVAAPSGGPKRPAVTRICS